MSDGVAFNWVIKLASLSAFDSCQHSRTAAGQPAGARATIIMARIGVPMDGKSMLDVVAMRGKTVGNLASWTIGTGRMDGAKINFCGQFDSLGRGHRC
jgi:hypothetical protein